MANISLKVGSVYCLECVQALRSFIGRMKGVQSVEMTGDDRVDITYEPSQLELGEERLRQLIKESIDKLGFKVTEE